jgi:PAS domain S-box-containing protein
MSNWVRTENNENSIAASAVTLSVDDQWLRLALQAAKMCAYQWDLKTNVISRSDRSAMEPRMDPDSDSWLYDKGLGNIYFEDRVWVEKQVQRAITTGGEFNVEFRVLPPSGTLHWLQAKGRAVYDKHQVAEHVFFVTQEITQRKQDELELKKQKLELECAKEKLKLTLDAAEIVAVPGITPEDYFQSAEICRFFGIEDELTWVNRETLLGRMHPDDQVLIKNQIEESDRSNLPFATESRILLPNGKVKWILGKGVHLKDAEGDQIRGYVVIQDVTKRKEAEELLRKKSEEMNEVNKKLELFSSVIAHDLKNPLTSIALSSDLIMRSRSLEESSRHGKSIKTVALRMSNLIDDVLQFSKSDRKTKIPKEPVSLQTILDTVCTDLAAAISKNQAEIRTNNVLPTVMGNQSQLMRLFQNLISNAIKFRSAQRPILDIDARDAGTHWRILIKDNGIGIKPSDQSVIFEPFERLSSKIEGTGLGLSICRQIVEEHGGSIEVESHIGIGSVFSFTLAKS